MDLRQFDTKKVSDEGKWLEIVAPDGVDVVCKIKVAGRDSKILKRRQQELAKKKERKAKYTAAEEEKDTIETAVVCTLDWEDVILDKKEVECTPENIRELYEDFQWIAEQVIVFIADRSNFLSQ